ncbi:MAG: ATP-binding protein, partial [Gemmatimonadaceae bacterium]
MSGNPLAPAAELERLAQHCQHLRLTRVAQTLPTLLEQAAAQELSYSAFLQSLLTLEVASKQEKHQALRVQMARFPFHKTLDGFDWKAQPSIDPKVIKELATMRFVANGANALLL